MRTYDLSESDLNIEDIPLCPLCDQPIDGWQDKAVGFLSDGTFSSYCFIHEDCGKANGERIK